MQPLHLYPLSFDNTNSHVGTAKASTASSLVTFPAKELQRGKIKEIWSLWVEANVDWALTVCLVPCSILKLACIWQIGSLRTIVPWGTEIKQSSYTNNYHFEWSYRCLPYYKGMALWQREKHAFERSARGQVSSNSSESLTLTHSLTHIIHSHFRNHRISNEHFLIGHSIFQGILIIIDGHTLYFIHWIFFHIIVYKFAISSSSIIS